MKILIAGANGMLGTELTRFWSAMANVDVVATDRSQLDIASLKSVRAGLSINRPDVVVNCAAYSAVDDAETHVEDAFRINTLGPRNLAIATQQHEIPLVHFSSDYVFDGTADHPYLEYDAVNPRGVYARSKEAGEQAVRDHTEHFIIARLSWLIGADGPNFVETMLRLGAERDSVSVVNDQIGSPTFCTDVAPVLDRLIRSQQYGLFHMSGAGATTWYDFAVEIFDRAGLKVAVEPTTTEAFGRPAPRPMFSYMRNLMLELAFDGDPMPPWRESLAAYLKGR